MTVKEYLISNKQKRCKVIFPWGEEKIVTLKSIDKYPEYRIVETIAKTTGMHEIYVEG